MSGREATMQSGDKCLACDTGVMLTYKSRRIGDNSKRYLKCDACGACGCEVTAAGPRQRRRKSDTSLVRSPVAISQKRGLMKADHPNTADAEARSGGKNMSLMTTIQAAKFCATDFGTLFDWYDLGAVPAPVLVAGHVRWRQADLEHWAAAGCPTGPRPKNATFQRVFLAAAEEITPIEKETEE
jgi:hypothetical protein